MDKTEGLSRLDVARSRFRLQPHNPATTIIWFSILLVTPRLYRRGVGVEI